MLRFRLSCQWPKAAGETAGALCLDLFWLYLLLVSLLAFSLCNFELLKLNFLGDGFALIFPFDCVDVILNFFLRKKMVFHTDGASFVWA